MTVCGLDHWNLGSSNPPAASPRPRKLQPRPRKLQPRLRELQLRHHYLPSCSISPAAPVSIVGTGSHACPHPAPLPMTHPPFAISPNPTCHFRYGDYVAVESRAGELAFVWCRVGSGVQIEPRLSNRFPPNEIRSRRCPQMRTHETLFPPRPPKHWPRPGASRRASAQRVSGTDIFFWTRGGSRGGIGAVL